MGPSYNDSFGSLQSPGMGGTEPMITSGGGDVVLPTAYDGGGSKRRWPMMVAIALFVIAIIAGVGAVIARMSGGQNLKTYTNQYLNLLIDGEAKDAVVPNNKLTVAVLEGAETNNIYSVPRTYNTLREENMGYYGKLMGLLGQMANRNASENSGDKKKQVEFLVNDSKVMLQYYFAGAALVYANADYEYYFEKSTLDGLMTAYGYPFAETSDEMLQSYKATIDELYSAKENFYARVAGTRCVEPDGVNYSCLEGYNSRDIRNMQETIMRLSSIMMTDVENILTMILMDAQNINTKINGA